MQTLYGTTGGGCATAEQCSRLCRAIERAQQCAAAGDISALQQLLERHYELVKYPAAEMTVNDYRLYPVCRQGSQAGKSPLIVDALCRYSDAVVEAMLRSTAQLEDVWESDCKISLLPGGDETARVTMTATLNLTALAAMYGRRSAVNLLLDRGFDVEGINCGGSNDNARCSCQVGDSFDRIPITPLFVAVAHGQVGVADDLLARGATFYRTRSFDRLAWLCCTDDDLRERLVLREKGVR